MDKFRNLSFLFALVAIIFAVLYFKEKSRFPIGLYICPKYGDCFVSEMYSDLDSCQSSAMMDKGNWLCDSTNLNDIRCHVDPSRIVSSYCK